MSDLPATIEINPSGGEPNTTVIWLHGLGADGNDFVPIVERFRSTASVRFIFPHAPKRFVSINGGMLMRAWFDIRKIDLLSDVDKDGLEDSRAMVEALMEREASRGISRIILAGFSQGGALALYTGLRSTKTLGGIIALSSYLPYETQELSAKACPVFLAHGLFDPVVPIHLGQSAKTQLESLAVPVDWHTYPMEHTVVNEEIEDIDQFLHTQLRVS